MANKNNVKWKLTAEELSGFCAQMAMMLNSGMLLYDGMEIIVQTHKDSSNAQAYIELSEALNRSGSLYDAMKEEKSWPEYMVEMIGIGERTGRLEEVMRGLSDYYIREKNIRGAIINAVTYPVVLGVMMVLILLVMIIKVLPVFRHVLANFGVEMTDSGNTMMQLGVSCGWIVLEQVAVALIAVLVCGLLMKMGMRERVMKTIRKVFPPMRKLASCISSARVASVLSVMISSGIPLDEALEMVPRVLDDEIGRQKVDHVRESVAQGTTIDAALTESGLFDRFHTGLIRMSCETGCLDSTMGKVASEYEKRVETDISNLVSIIEPSLVAMLSIVIGAVLLSVMLPMAGIISSIL